MSIAQLNVPVIVQGVFAIFFILIVLAIVVDRKKCKSLVKKYIKPEDINHQLKDFYNKVDKKGVRKLEIIRRILIICQILIVISIIFFIIEFDKITVVQNGFNVFELVFPIFVASMCIYVLARFKYGKIHNNIIISNIIKEINPNLKYIDGKMDNGITYTSSQDAYEKAKFDNSIYNRYYCNYCIYGNLDNSNIKINKIRTAFYEGRYNGRDRGETTVFEGIFVEVDSKKNIGNDIKIVRDKFSFENKEMDSSEFEKYFDVYTEDRILAMRILTHDVMECLVNFYNKIKYEIVIKGDKIYLRFFTGELLEPRIYGKVLNNESLLVYYSILKFIIEVTNKINTEIQNIEI